MLGEQLYKTLADDAGGTEDTRAPLFWIAPHGSAFTETCRCVFLPLRVHVLVSTILRL
jgi:hypothetical protein